MRVFNIVVILSVLFAFAVANQKAIAVLKGTTADSGITGTVTFEFQGTGFGTDGADPMKVTWSITGLTTSPDADHGLHIHETGILSADGSAALGHYVGSGSTTHGCYPNPVRHAGDLGNITFAAGASSGSFIRDLGNLQGNYSYIGRMVVLHAAADDCTGAVGNAGARLATGVIGVLPSTSMTDDPPATQETTAPFGATCVFQGGFTDPAIQGTVYFDTNSTHVNIYAEITGLAAGSVHGFHVHTWGNITDGTGPAGHWDPLAAGIHAIPPRKVRHMGDLGNLAYYSADNTTAYYLEALPISEFSLKDAIGRAMILHAQKDDCNATNSGNAGARVAACVIGLRPTSIDTNPYAPVISQATRDLVVPQTAAECAADPVPEPPKEPDAPGEPGAGFCITASLVLVAASALFLLL